MKGRARLGRYAAWQAHDFVVERAAAIVIVLGLILYLASFTISSAKGGSGEPPSAAALASLAPLLMKNLLGTTWLVIGLLATNGISSTDRATGRFRFLFSKPLRAAGYYGQAFVINTVLATACLLGAVLLLGHWTAAPSDFVHDSLAIAACGVVGISALCFFFSAVVRFDWLGTLGLWGAVAILHVRYPDATWLRFLPPLNVVSDQIDNLADGRAVAMAPLLWFVVFGLLCFTAGLVILRRRPLST